MSREQSDSTLTMPRVVGLAAGAIIIAGLYFASEVLIPVALAVLISFVLAPVATKLERWGLGRAGSVVLVALLSITLLGALGWIVAGQFVDLAGRLPQYKENIRNKARSIRMSTGVVGQASQTLTEIGHELREPGSTENKESSGEKNPIAESVKAATESALPSTLPKQANSANSISNAIPGGTDNAVSPKPILVEVTEPPPSTIQVLRAALGPLLGPLGTASIVAVLVAFMLLQREDLRDRLIRLIGTRRLNVTTQAIDDATTRISKYLLMQCVVNATYGIPIALGLYIIGIPTAVLCGLLCGLMRFIPYLGPWIGASLPIALSLTTDSWWQPVATLGLFIVVELISNNVVETTLYGQSVGVSPVALLVSAIFWAWLWGGVGLFLSVPLTVCLIVLGKHVASLEFLNVLLGDQPVLAPPAQFYQRLLSEDTEDASELLEENIKEMTLIDVYDKVVIPALSLAEVDRHHGRLDDERQRLVRETLDELIDEIGEIATQSELKQAEKREKNPEKAVDSRLTKTLAATGAIDVPILCLPGRDDADELSAKMLTQVLGRVGFLIEAVTVDKLASEMLEKIKSSGAKIICISAMPPYAVSHARYLLKRIRGRFPELHVIVGLWNLRTDRSRVRMRLTGDEKTLITTTFEETIVELNRLVPTLSKAAEEQSRDAAAELSASQRLRQPNQNSLGEPLGGAVALPG